MYGKLFVQIYDGTLATEGPWQALVTFQQLIILADKEGVVDMTAEAISRRTTIPFDIIYTGIKALEEPDVASRSPDEEGRRIVRLSDGREWGWRIVNYIHYRNIRSQEERREYMRNYQRKRRAKSTDVNSDVNIVNEFNQSSKQYAVSISNKHKGNTTTASNEKISFSADGWSNIPDALLSSWQKAYPAMDIHIELEKARAWLLSNPKNKKSNYARFLTNWFSRAQDRAPSQTHRPNTGRKTVDDYRQGATAHDRDIPGTAKRLD